MHRGRSRGHGGFFYSNLEMQAEIVWEIILSKRIPQETEPDVGTDKAYWETQ
jgi:hypothetical protein